MALMRSASMGLLCRGELNKGYFLTRADAESVTSPRRHHMDVVCLSHSRHERFADLLHWPAGALRLPTARSRPWTLMPLELNLPDASDHSADASPASTGAPAPLRRAPLLDRDLSILAFNERVFDWAERIDVPLLERLRYLTIVSSNLDEFFEVRVEPYLALTAAGGMVEPTDTFQTLVGKVRALVDRQYALYQRTLLPALAQHGIRVVSHGERSTRQRRWVRTLFEREVRPLLVPVSLDPAHPFPQVANKSLNFIVRLAGSDAFGRHNEIAIVRVPRALPRFFRMPLAVAPEGKQFVSVSSVVRAHLADLFPGREVLEMSQFRVTRHSDLAVDDDDARNLRTVLRQGLTLRHFGRAVRLEISSGCSGFLADFLRKQFDLPEAALYRVEGPVNLVRLAQLVDLAAEPALLFPPWSPGWPQSLPHSGSLFSRLHAGDVLVHQPYESFDSVLAMLREAVDDPDVVVIKQTIYRTGSDLALLELLREGVRQGKEVMAVVELKARFDEEANINWAETLERAGAQVVYGVVGLKTHAKMLLVTRREGRRMRRYGHLSTGNYNPHTARLYTDLGYFTADAAVTADMDQMFNHLASQNRLPRMRRLLVAPFHLHRRMLDYIAEVTAAAAAGKSARIVAKMNALTDEALALALQDAAAAGAKIDLIVRGACILPVDAAPASGASEDAGYIRVRSIIGRFLEHSRVFYFAYGDEEVLYLSSADWMSRNMMRRLELAWPVTDPALRQRVVDECLVASLHDDCDAWQLQPDGSYVRALDPVNGRSAQQALMARYANTPRRAGPAS